MRRLAVVSLAASLVAGGALASGLEIEVAGEANGTVVIELFDDVAPAHVEQIRTLAAEGAYDGVVFHRVIDGFMAQTGDVQYGRAGEDLGRAGTGKSDRPNIKAEFSDIPFERGVVGMARAPGQRRHVQPVVEQESQRVAVAHWTDEAMTPPWPAGVSCGRDALVAIL